MNRSIVFSLAFNSPRKVIIIIDILQISSLIFIFFLVDDDKFSMKLLCHVLPPLLTHHLSNPLDLICHTKIVSLSNISLWKNVIDSRLSFSVPHGIKEGFIVVSKVLNFEDGSVVKRHISLPIHLSLSKILICCVLIFLELSEHFTQKRFANFEKVVLKLKEKP